jgi:GH24 family phage-related lysozyme (muramidase)
MRMTREGLALIKQFEGFRGTAYKCPAGVWTIFYGHTSMAGPPKVTPGMKGTRAEGERILKEDLKVYEAGVRRAIKIELTPNQYSACVSLCYNIGVGAFGRSSVARFCNRRQWKNAADAFALWNKAGGRVLPGLTRRRAAEAALFMSSKATVTDDIRPIVDEPKGKPMALSTTNIAAGVTATAGITAATKDIVDNTGAIFSGSNIIIVILILIILAGAGWIIRERWQKARDWDI